MIKINRTRTPPASLKHQKTRKSGVYSSADVKKQLHEDFHGKCYLCEKLLTDTHVEHLRPHHQAKFPDPDKENSAESIEHWNRKFDWNNLFPSCAHCNELKGTMEHIIDCCKTDPEQMLRQKMDAAKVKVTANNPDDPFAKETAELIENCFETTGPKFLDAGARKKLLKKSIDIVRKELETYKNMKVAGNVPMAQYETLRDLVRSEEEFAGFVRTEVRDYLDCCPELKPLLAIEDAGGVEGNNKLEMEVPV